MKTSVMIFLLFLAIIVAVYYVGTSTDLLSGAKAFQIAGFTLTGRNSAGVFGGYPNAGTNPKVQAPAF